MFKSVLVAVDGSDHSKRAVACAASIAGKFDAQLIVMHVMKHIGSDRVPKSLKHLARIEHIEVSEADILQSTADGITTEARDLAETNGAIDIETIVETGDPADRIVEYCNARNVDLVVMGRRGLGDVASLLLGSVSHKLAQRTSSACLTVPPQRISLSQFT